MGILVLKVQKQNEDPTHAPLRVESGLPLFRLHLEAAHMYTDQVSEPVS